MAIYRHNGGQVFSLPCDVENFWFTFGHIKKQPRTLTDCLRKNADANNIYAANKTEKYLSRPFELRHLRIHQWYRYYKTVATKCASQNDTQPIVKNVRETKKTTAGFTHELHEAHDEVDDETNPHFDMKSSADPVGTKYRYGDPSLQFECVRRENKHFGCVRTWMYNLSTVKCADGRSERDHYYESLLFRSTLEVFQERIY